MPDVPMTDGYKHPEEVVEEVLGLNMSSMQMEVREFHRAMKLPVAHLPTALNMAAQLRRVALIREELQELEEAFANGDYIEQIDALCDILYVTFGTAVEMGVNLTPFYAEVHHSNMCKEGGELRADGKLLKPEGWQPPDIRGLFARLYGGIPQPRERAPRAKLTEAAAD